ncbi:hypothetical protein NOVA_35205 [Nocardia nova]|nr:hypothetical protein [Nocardia nova]MBV7708042.1 hypothetical protein [Nocardia nova]
MTPIDERVREVPMAPVECWQCSQLRESIRAAAESGELRVLDSAVS